MPLTPGSIARKIALTLLVCTVSLVGCSAETVKLEQEFEQKEETADSTGCLPIILSVEDKRTDTSDLGRLGITDVTSNDVVLWVSDAFRHHGFPMGDESNDSGDAVSVDVRFTNIRTSGSSKTTNVVLGVTPESQGSTMIYRGVNTSVYWSASREAISKSFDRALNNAVNQIKEGLGQSC